MSEVPPSHSTPPLILTTHPLAATTHPLTSSSYGSGPSLKRGTSEYSNCDLERLGIVRVPKGVEKGELQR